MGYGTAGSRTSGKAWRGRRGRDWIAKGPEARVHDNTVAICLAVEIEAEKRAATPEEQEKLIRFIGLGAPDLANSVFCCPGEVEFRKGWDEIGSDLGDAVGEVDYASLARCIQYAHFTSELVIGRSGLACCVSAGAAAACSSPVSARACSPR